MIYTTNVYSNNRITASPTRNDLLLHNHRNQHQRHSTAATTTPNKSWICRKRTRHSCHHTSVLVQGVAFIPFQNHESFRTWPGEKHWSAPNLTNRGDEIPMNRLTFLQEKLYEVFSAAIHPYRSIPMQKQPTNISNILNLEVHRWLISPVNVQNHQTQC